MTRAGLAPEVTDGSRQKYDGHVVVSRHPLNYRFAGDDVPSRPTRWKWEACIPCLGSGLSWTEGWASFRWTAVRKGKAAVRRARRRHRLYHEAKREEHLSVQ